MWLCQRHFIWLHNFTELERYSNYFIMFSCEIFVYSTLQAASETDNIRLIIKLCIFSVCSFPRKLGERGFFVTFNSIQQIKYFLWRSSSVFLEECLHWDSKEAQFKKIILSNNCQCQDVKKVYKVVRIVLV